MQFYFEIIKNKFFILIYKGQILYSNNNIIQYEKSVDGVPLSKKCINRLILYIENNIQNILDESLNIRELIMYYIKNEKYILKDEYGDTEDGFLSLSLNHNVVINIIITYIFDKINSLGIIINYDSTDNDVRTIKPFTLELELEEEYADELHHRLIQQHPNIELYANYYI